MSIFFGYNEKLDLWCIRVYSSIQNYTMYCVPWNYLEILIPSSWKGFNNWYACVDDDDDLMKVEKYPKDSIIVNTRMLHSKWKICSKYDDSIIIIQRQPMKFSRSYVYILNNTCCCYYHKLRLGGCITLLIETWCHKSVWANKEADLHEVGCSNFTIRKQRACQGIDSSDHISSYNKVRLEEE